VRIRTTGSVAELRKRAIELRVCAGILVQLESVNDAEGSRAPYPGRLRSLHWWLRAFDRFIHPVTYFVPTALFS